MKKIYTLKETKGITSPKNLFDNIKNININYNQENLILFCFDTRNRIIHSEVLFKGGINSTVLDPKVLFKIALLNNAMSIIIAHNHPSGDLSPSIEDIKIFERLKQAGDILTLCILDSIIFNREEYYSLNNI